jgi:hypothetical protein
MWFLIGMNVMQIKRGYSFDEEGYHHEEGLPP